MAGLKLKKSIYKLKGSLNYLYSLVLLRYTPLNHEAFKVWKPGGVIRLSCPDLETYARNYIEGNKEFYQDKEIVKACTFKNAQTPSQIFAAKAFDSGGAHKWFHDFSSLKNMLEREGFMNVRKVNRLEGRTPDLAALEIAPRELESVYVEAQKP